MKPHIPKRIFISQLMIICFLFCCKKSDRISKLIVVETSGGTLNSDKVRSEKSRNNKTSYVSNPKGTCTGYMDYKYAFVAAGMSDSDIQRFKEKVRMFLEQDLNLNEPGHYYVKPAPQPILFQDVLDPYYYEGYKSSIRAAFYKANVTLGFGLVLQETTLEIKGPYQVSCKEIPPITVPPVNPNVPGGGSVPVASEVGIVIQNNLFAFLADAPCDVVKAWLKTARFTPDASIINKLNLVATKELAVGPMGASFNYDDVAHIQNIDDASSTVVNMDYFPVTINRLPTVNGQQLTKEQFLHYVRVNINLFTSTDMFLPYNDYSIDDRAKWNSNDPKGAIIKIDIPGPDNASVITSYSASDRWTFTTIHEPSFGAHPVSGNRDFGIVTNPNGTCTFYVRGVDRLTSWDIVLAQVIPDFFAKNTGIPFSNSDALWKSFQQKLKDFIISKGGSAIIQNPEIQRPDWEIVKKVLQGILPLSTISKKCPD